MAQPILEAFPKPDGFIDRRSFTVPFQRRGKRAWKSITGITLHQTACDMGERIERYDTMGAHAAVLRSGRTLLLHPLDQVVWHGNGWNSRCIGIEVNGLFAAEPGGHVWDDPTTKVHEVAMRPTDVQIERTKDLIRYFAGIVAAEGGAIEVLCAHRQSSRDRRDDPGYEVWQRVAVPLHAELGLTDGGVGFAIGGYPIPESWDARCKGVKY